VASRLLLFKACPVVSVGQSGSEGEVGGRPPLSPFPEGESPGGIVKGSFMVGTGM
jgi:hypothetical protein